MWETTWGSWSRPGSRTFGTLLLENDGDSLEIPSENRFYVVTIKNILYLNKMMAYKEGLIWRCVLASAV